MTPEKNGALGRGRGGPGRDDPPVPPAAGGSPDRVMDRRTFLGTLTGGLLAAPLAAEAQVPEKIARIGMLRSENRPLDDRIRQNIADVRAGLQDEDHAEGRHYRIDYYSPTSE